MSAHLVHYEAARRELAEARRVDEVKNIRDKAEAIERYAKMAKDGELIANATEIKLRAERRAGEMLREMEKNKGAAGGGAKSAPRGPYTEPRDKSPKLADFGVTKKDSHNWQKLAALSEEKFETRVAEVKKRAVASVEQTREERQREKRERREERERQLGAKQLAYPTKLYGVIVADDEWDQEVWSRETGMDRHAANHYVTAADAHTSEEMHERTKARFTPAPDCLLAMWTTNQHLAIALKLMELRGFRYVTNFCWGKDKFGLGYWNREKHELLLIGVRGDVPCPAPGEQWESLVMAPRGDHSAKPEVFLEMIEAYFPNLPKIEINRRGPPRPGWDAYGNEIAEAAE